MSRLAANSKAEKRVILICSGLIIFLVGLDVITKLIVIDRIAFGQRIPIIPNFFNLTYVRNEGAAWGILKGYGWLLLLIAIGVAISIVAYIRTLTEGWAERYFALALILSGIVGNSIDRVWRRFVVDFLDFYFGTYHWPSFNVADSAITVGVTIFIISSFFRPQDKPEEEEAAATKE